MTDLSSNVRNLTLFQNAFEDMRLPLFSVLMNAGKTANLTVIYIYLQALLKSTYQFTCYVNC